MPAFNLVPGLKILRSGQAMVLHVTSKYASVRFRAVVNVKDQDGIYYGDPRHRALIVNAKGDQGTQVFVTKDGCRRATIGRSVKQANVLCRVVGNFLFRQVGILPLFLHSKAKTRAFRCINVDQIVSPATLRSCHAIINYVLSNAHLANRERASSIYGRLT